MDHYSTPSAPAAMAPPLLGRGCRSATITPMYHPSAQRPISFASSPRFLLYPLDDENFSSGNNKASNKRKRRRASLPPSSGGQSESGRDPTARAGLDLRDREAACAVDHSDKNNYITASAPRHHAAGREVSKDMAQLITLQLQPRIFHKRQPSYTNVLEVVQNDPGTPPPRIPAKSKRRSLSLSKSSRVSHTPEEWHSLIEEVKLLFDRRQWRSCTAKSKSLINDSQYQPNLHPLHNVYLTFYTALSLEQSACSLPQHSLVRASLLQDAATYLRQCKMLISTTYQTLPSRSTSRYPPQRSSLSSLPTKPPPFINDRSSSTPPRASLFSPLSTPSELSCFPFSPSTTDPSHPQHQRKSSIINFSHKRNTSSTSSAILRPAPLRIQKRVSFSSSLEDLTTVITSPRCSSIAKDTMQARQLPSEVDDVKGKIAEMENWELINCFPMPPSPSRCPSLVADSESEDEYFPLPTPSSSSTSSSPSYEQQRKRDLPPSAPSPHTQRFHATLCAFESQVNWHARSVEAQLASLSSPMGQSLPHANGPDSISVAIPDGAEKKEEKKKKTEAEGKAELQRRIAVRRKCGWKRERFDGSRYQRLCETVLEEVDGALSH